MNFFNYIHLKNSLLQVFIIGALLLSAGSLDSSGQLYGQERNKYERKNRQKNKSNRRSDRRGDRARSNKRQVRSTEFKTKTKQGDRAYKGDISGRKVITKSTNRKSKASQAQPNPYAGRKRTNESTAAKKASKAGPPRSTRRSSETASRNAGKAGLPRSTSRSGEKTWSSKKNGRSLNKRSKKVTFTGNKRYAQKAPIRSPRKSFDTRGSNAKAKNMHSKRITFTDKQRYGSGNVRSITRSSEAKVFTGRIKPRSASGAYSVRKRKSPYNAFRPKKSWEKAFKGDITGRTFQTKRTQDRQRIKKPPKVNYTRPDSKGRGDRASKAVGGGYKSISRPGERAWNKDISGNKLRIRTSKKPRYKGVQFETYPTKSGRRGDKAYNGRIKGDGGLSISNRKEKAGRAIGKSSSLGASTGKGVSFQGNIKSKKPLKGGGSISGNRWNNRGQSTTRPNNSDQSQRVRSYQGTLKARKPLKGGGSISGKRWNNNGQSTTKVDNSEQTRRVRGFQGTLKSRKPLKGGGSISGNRWNNRGQSTTRPNNSDQSQRVRGYQGTLKARKPLKGGGSISGNRWNNGGSAITKLNNSTQSQRIRGFQGNMKAVKKTKGVEYMPRDRRSFQGVRSSQYTGDRKQMQKGKYDGGLSFYKGNQKRKFDYKKNPQAADGSLKVREIKNKSEVTNYQGNLKHRERGINDAGLSFYRGNDKRTFSYKKNPNAVKESLKVRELQSNDKKAFRYTGNLKDRRNLKQNPAADKYSLKKDAPGRNYYKSGKFEGRTKVAYKVRNKPNAVDGSMKGLAPTKAAIKASQYQGNVKMSKKRIEDRHPSLKYMQGKNSSTQEKEKLFSVKLLFAKWFKKSESQPKVIKKKERAPRFDNREKDLWYD